MLGFVLRRALNRAAMPNRCRARSLGLRWRRTLPVGLQIQLNPAALSPRPPLPAHQRNRTTFIFGIVAFKNLPRQTFGRLQSHLFPLYFLLSTACAALLWFTARGAGAPPAQLALLAAGAATSLLNLVVAEPGATANMFARYKLEAEPAAVRDEAAIAKLRKQFGAWHGASSLLNLVALVAAVAHGVWLGARLGF